MSSLQPVESMGNKVEKKDERSAQISFKLSADDKVAFDVAVAKSGEDLTSVLRHFVREYATRHGAGLDVGIAERKRAERNAYILESLREFSVINRNNTVLLEWMDRGLGLKPGTLYSLLEY